MNIGKRIKEIRKAKGMSQKELAELIGITANSFSRYEIGKRRPNLEMIERIANALNVPITDIVDYGTIKSSISKKTEAQDKVIDKVGNTFSEDTQTALILFELLKQTNQRKVIDYMQQLLEEEEEKYIDLLKRAQIIINDKIEQQGMGTEDNE